MRDAAAAALGHAGMTVETVTDAAALEAALASPTVDLVVIDLDLPAGGGADALRIAGAGGRRPVIVIADSRPQGDRAITADDGADDYVVRPFSSRELVARTRAVLRRVPATSLSPLEFGELSINPGLRQVTVNGRDVTLTRREFDLLYFLASTPRRVRSHQELLRYVWGVAGGSDDARTITEHVRRLRQKVEPDPQHPRWVVTEWGVGYKFEP